MEDEMKNILERIEKGVRKSLEVDKLMIRDRRWEHADCYDKSKIIDEQITDILSRKDTPATEESE